MNSVDALAKAIRIAATEFEHTVDKGGAPYVLHCLAVMNGVRDLGDEVMAAAVLHDLLEDRGPAWTADRLRSEGFSETTVTLITALTHDPADSYDAYVDKVAKHPPAVRIKLADLEQNMTLTRLPEIDDKAVERLRKYRAVWERLTRYRTIGAAGGARMRA